MITLKQHGYWELNKYTELRYFKNGRANMHTRITYCIEFANAEYYEDHGVDLDITSGSFWITTKREAEQVFRNLIKKHELAGCKLKSELFINKKGSLV
jgi:hypothetical protein